jgi:uncharacterized membrane protein (DUF485 family)
MDMIMVNSVVMVLYYFITAFFLLALAKNFLATKSIQEAVLYGIIMIPFVLRLLRLK